MKKNILLVQPKHLHGGYTDIPEIRILGKIGAFLSASLGTVAALTPSEYNVTIVDENIEALPEPNRFDLVGLTGYYFHLPRAFKLAAIFRQAGVPVVCGGPSVSLSPERWRPFSDVLIIGEAEHIWPKFLKDFASGSYGPEYVEKELIDLSCSPIPDYNGYSPRMRSQYNYGVVQTSRGCPYNCEFCSVHVYLGRKIRRKQTSQVLAEVKQLHQLGYEQIFLADDNFSAGRKHAWDILQAIQEWNSKQKSPIEFTTQLSIETAKDEAFLELAAQAGLRYAYIGIESPNQESLAECDKVMNLQSDVLENIKKFHAHGIQVIASTIVGFDHDGPSIFQEQLDFFMKAGTPLVWVYALQAHDSTRLKQRMVEAGRYIDYPQTFFHALDKRELDNWNFMHLTLIPKNFSEQEFRHGIHWLLQQLYDPDNLRTRIESFLQVFENSTSRSRSAFPRERLDRKKIPRLFRLLCYVFLQLPKQDRKELKQLLRMAKKYHYPKKIKVVITQYFIARNIRMNAPLM